MPNEHPEIGPALQSHLSGSLPRTRETAGEGTFASGPGEAPVDLSGLLAEPMSPDELGWLAHYRVLKVLGRGGMGVVFMAEDTHLRRVVALKAILPEYAGSASARERFLREARACAALKSDHVVTLY